MIRDTLPEQLKKMFHPYMFVLKEGKGIEGNTDLLDYSLQMLHVQSIEKIASPKKLPSKARSKPKVDPLDTELSLLSDHLKKRLS